MLEFKNIKIQDLRDLTTVVFVIIDDIYKQVADAHVKNRINIDKSILSDSEIITISILGELLSCDSERAWHSFVSKNMRDLFPKLCERSRFNRTKRNLMILIERIREQLNDMTRTCSADLRIIDSFPVPVCKFGRAKFHKLFKYHEANYGYSASKKETYYGY